MSFWLRNTASRVQQIEVPHPGVEQQSQWLTIRRAHPDYVVLRGWGVMNPVALKTGAKVDFPVDHIVGNVWSIGRGRHARR